MAMRCFCFHQPWSDSDQEADQDEKDGAYVKEAGQSEDGEATMKASATASEDGAEETTPAPVAVEVEGVDGETRASTTAAVIPSVKGVAEVIAPASGDVIAIPEANSVNRTEDILTEGGLLITEVEGGKWKKIRRLELDAETGILSWSVDFFLGKRVEKVQLQDARIMCTEKLVKIGVSRRKDDFTFEASDVQEAAAICDCLVRQAQKAKDKYSEKAKGKEQGDTPVAETPVADVPVV